MNYTLIYSHSQNAFFTPFKHPLPDDSRQAHPIAPIQTAGATSQTWTLRKQRLMTYAKDSWISMDKLWDYCVLVWSFAVLAIDLSARHHLCLLLAPFSLGLQRHPLEISHACKHVCAHTVVSSAHAQACVWHICYACALSPLMLRHTNHEGTYTVNAMPPQCSEQGSWWGREKR